MYYYNAVQWMMFFFIYSVLGWCFESSYVSLKAKKWTNRGFMKGPYLPIYGFGAIILLFATIPFRDSIFKMFVVGAVSATVFEYITGVTMEAIFKIRYWDYSEHKFNFQGQICLSSTIAWGGFTLFLVEVLHKPIETIIVSANFYVLAAVATIITVLFLWDSTVSIKTAIDLRILLAQIEEHKKKTIEELRGLNDRLGKQALEMANRIPNTMDSIYKTLETLTEYIGKIEKSVKETTHSDAARELGERVNNAKKRITKLVTADKLRMLKRNPTKRNNRFIEELEKIKNRKK